MGQWKITTPPAIPPVTLAQALAQARIDDVDENQKWLKDAIADATGYAETACQKSFITRTITATYWPERSDVPPEANPFPAYAALMLFRGPVQSIVSAKDRYGNAVSSQLRKVGNSDAIQLNGSAVGPVTIVYVAGYGDTPDDVPSDIRRAIVAHVAHMFRFREADEDSIPVGLSYIYDRYRSAGAG